MGRKKAPTKNFGQWILFSRIRNRLIRSGVLCTAPSKEDLFSEIECVQALDRILSGYGWQFDMYRFDAESLHLEDVPLGTCISLKIVKDSVRERMSLSDLDDAEFDTLFGVLENYLGCYLRIKGNQIYNDDDAIAVGIAVLRKTGVAVSPDMYERFTALCSDLRYLYDTSWLLAHGFRLTDDGKATVIFAVEDYCTEGVLWDDGCDPSHVNPYCEIVFKLLSRYMVPEDAGTPA